MRPKLQPSTRPSVRTNKRFPEARDALDQHVAIGKQRDQRAENEFILTDVDFAKSLRSSDQKVSASEYRDLHVRWRLPPVRAAEQACLLLPNLVLRETHSRMGRLGSWRAPNCRSSQTDCRRGLAGRSDAQTDWRRTRFRFLAAD